MTIRRMKTYTGGQGYVYQYYFVGKRAAMADRSQRPATEYVFDVTSDRKTTFAVSVFLTEDAASAMGRKHKRRSPTPNIWRGQDAAVPGLR